MVRQRVGVAGALSRRQGCSDALVSSPSPFLVMDLGLGVGPSGRGSFLWPRRAANAQLFAELSCFNG